MGQCWSCKEELTDGYCSDCCVPNSEVDKKLCRALTDQRRRLCAETDAVQAELTRVRAVARQQIDLLRRAARLIHDRPHMVSGGLEMAECDAACKEADLPVWTWTLKPNVKGETSNEG